MKLAVISDLHGDLNGFSDDDLAILWQVLQTEQVDHLHFAGDLANKVQRALEIVDFFKIRQLPTTFNWGNHEMVDLTEGAIEAFPSPAFLNIQGLPLNQKTVLVGYNGWYDYSFALDYQPEKIAKMKQLYWYDRGILRQGSDAQVEKQLRGQLKTLLDFLALTEKDVILATHFVPKKEFIVYQELPELVRWNALNAFLGTAALGELLDQYPNVRHCVFGHTHRRFEDLQIKETTYSCRPLGYYFEWQLTRDFVLENQLVKEYRPVKLRSVLKRHAASFASYRRKHLAEEFRRGMTVIDLG